MLNSTRPQKVIQSTFQTPVAEPYRYARMPVSSGMCQTQAASTNVTIEPISTASQAETRTASSTSRSTTGIRATRQVSPRLPTGSTICVNILILPFADRAGAPDQKHLPILRRLA